MKFVDYYNEIHDVYEKTNLILEGLPIKSFNKSIPSHINKEWYKKRQAEGTTGSYIKNVNWDTKLGTLTLYYEVKPTYSSSIKTVTKTGKIISGGVYKTEIQFEDAEQFLGKRKEFLKLSKKEQIDKMRILTKNGSIRLFSNNLGYLFQGEWRRNFEKDANIYPIPANRMKDKKIWLKRHGKDIYANKIIMEPISTIGFVVDTIAKMIRDKYS